MLFRSNGVLIKPISLLGLENELARYFPICPLPQDDTEDSYSFDAFSNLIAKNPKQIFVILDEIKKVHDDVLLQLTYPSIDQQQLASLIHKVKGGALLLQATRFIKSCESLEKEGDFLKQLHAFKDLLLEQNQQIKRYQEKQIHL